MTIEYIILYRYYIDMWTLRYQKIVKIMIIKKLLFEM